MKSTKSIVIVNGTRTPMGSFNGALSHLTAAELGAIAIKGALDKSGVSPNDIDEVYMGCVLQAGLKQAPARQAAVHAGIPNSAGAVTLNKVCGSGMQAVIFAHDQIKLGSISVAVAGGMESMSNAPHLIKNRTGMSGHQTIQDSLFLDGLEDAFSSKAMGEYAQATADTHGLTREEMDEFAIESLNRANRAIEQNILADEVTSIPVKTRKAEFVVQHDEQPLKAKLDKIPTLRPVFARDGTITAANASSISDGASALVLMDEAEALSRGLSPIARIVDHARHSHHPEQFTTAPVGAINNLFEKTGWNKNSTDLFEINEAFAMVTMIAMRELDLDASKVNVNGGACAQGHPLGSTASRLIVTLMHSLKHQNKQRGIASMCIGGGEALAMAIEIV